MGKVDVCFTIGIHGSFQCEENDIDRELEDARDRVERKLEYEFPPAVGEVDVDIVGVADIDPETGDLKQRYVSEMEINGN